MTKCKNGNHSLRKKKVNQSIHINGLDLVITDKNFKITITHVTESSRKGS